MSSPVILWLPNGGDSLLVSAAQDMLTCVEMISSEISKVCLNQTLVNYPSIPIKENFPLFTKKNTS